MKYYVAPDGTSAMQTTDGPLGASSVPDGWAEVTAEEYEARIAEGRAAADARAEEFIASNGAPGPEIPPTAV
ncbi:hypothetical protein ACWFR1_12135 [Streptomyces sp. NPDC055103]